MNGEGDARGCLRGLRNSQGDGTGSPSRATWTLGLKQRLDPGVGEAESESLDSAMWPGLVISPATQVTPMTSSNCLFSLHLICSPFKQG